MHDGAGGPLKLIFESEVPDELFLLGDAVNQARQFPAHLPRLDVFEACDFHGLGVCSLFLVLCSWFLFSCGVQGGERRGGKFLVPGS